MTSALSTRHLRRGDEVGPPCSEPLTLHHETSPTNDDPRGTDQKLLEGSPAEPPDGAFAALGAGAGAGAGAGVAAAGAAAAAARRDAAVLFG